MKKQLLMSLLLISVCMISSLTLTMDVKTATEKSKMPSAKPLWSSQAIEEEDDKAMQAYLDTGGDIDGRSAQGVTPLQAAIYRNKKKMALWLIDRGARVDLEDENGHTPLLNCVCPYPTSTNNSLSTRQTLALS